MRRKLTSKTYLKLLLVAGVLAVIGGGAGTFASFTAQTTNDNNTFATGTLLLDNTKGTTTCHSASDATDNAITSGCATLFTVPSLSSGSTVQEANLTLSNVGTLDAGGISFYASDTCVTEANDTGGPTFGGGGDLCGALQVAIVETDSSFNHTSGNPALGCAYGSTTSPAAGEACAFGSSFNLGNLPSTSASPQALTLASGASSNTGTQLTHGQNRYFVVRVSTPGTSGLNNTFQNRKGVFALTWRITQA